jgi:hypothetical protein
MGVGEVCEQLVFGYFLSWTDQGLATATTYNVQIIIVAFIGQPASGSGWLLVRVPRPILELTKS